MRPTRRKRLAPAFAIAAFCSGLAACDGGRAQTATETTPELDRAEDPTAGVDSSGDSAQNGKAPSYLRFEGQNSGEGALYTALVTMAGEDGVRVDLIGAVHVGDAAYYDDLERRFASYESLLYEMVRPEGAAPDDVPKTSSGISMFQRALKDALDLEFQLDAIDYSKANFVHADLDWESFQKLQKKKGESIAGLLLKATAVELERRKKGGEAHEITPVQLLIALSSEDSARTLKYLLAQQMQEAEHVLAGIEDPDAGPDGGSVLVVERNRKALAVLRERIAEGDRRLGIFYGAGHLPDLERRLIDEFGMRRTGFEWIPAWRIEKKKETPPPAGGIFERLWGPVKKDAKRAEEPGGSEGDSTPGANPDPVSASAPAPIDVSPGDADADDRRP